MGGTKILPSNRGFTVVELMVATAVFGLVLLVIATAIINLSRLYYKGLTDTKVQATSRQIVDTIAQSIQFNGGIVTSTPGSPASGTPYSFCIGNTQYSFVLGRMLSDSPSGSEVSHVLVSYNPPGGCNSSLAPQFTNGRELLAPGMRLAKLDVQNLGGTYYLVNARVVYGDDAILTNPTATNAACNSAMRYGTQFCAVSDITAAVTKRVQ